MILLDTNAVLYLLAGHRRAGPLRHHKGQLWFSPMVTLELCFLAEIGRGRFVGKDPLGALRDDPRWKVDEAPLAEIVDASARLTWTRDPFDRLIAGHALARGYRLATSDETLLANMPARAILEL